MKIDKSLLLISIGIVILEINSGCKNTPSVLSFTATPIQSDTVEITKINPNSTFLTPEIYYTVTKEPTVTYTPTHTILPSNTGGGGKIVYSVTNANGEYSDIYL